MATFPALVLVPLFWLRSWLPKTFRLSFWTTTVLLILVHYSNDLRTDAQSSLSLLFLPYLVAGLTLFVAVPSGIIEIVRNFRRFGEQRRELVGKTVASISVNPQT